MTDGLTGNGGMTSVHRVCTGCAPVWCTVRQRSGGHSARSPFGRANDVSSFAGRFIRWALVVCSSLVAVTEAKASAAHSELFIEHCVSSLSTGDPSDKSSLIAFSDDEVERFQSYFEDKTERSIWAFPSGRMVLIIASQGQPCEVMAFGLQKSAKDAIWAEVVSSLGAVRDDDGPAKTYERYSLEKNYAVLPLGSDKFVQLFSNFKLAVSTSSLTLTAIRTSASPQVCAVLPEECD